MSEPARHLHVAADTIGEVDVDTGELHTDKESLEHALRAMRDEYDQLLRNYKGKCRQLSELERDKDAEAQVDPLWPLAVRLFAYHNKVHHHPGAEWTTERFAMVRKLRGRRKVEDWLEGCLRAIAGLAADQWRVSKKLTMWEHAFGNRKSYEQALAHCPPDWTPPPGVEQLLGKAPNEA